MLSITEADSHQTGDKYVLAEHKLSLHSRALLEEYFAPFNALLEQFLGGRLGYEPEPFLSSK